MINGHETEILKFCTLSSDSQKPVFLFIIDLKIDFPFQLQGHEIIRLLCFGFFVVWKYYIIHISTKLKHELKELQSAVGFKNNKPALKVLKV